MRCAVPFRGGSVAQELFCVSLVHCFEEGLSAGACVRSRDLRARAHMIYQRTRVDHRGGRRVEAQAHVVQVGRVRVRSCVCMSPSSYTMMNVNAFFQTRHNACPRYCVRVAAPSPSSHTTRTRSPVTATTCRCYAVCGRTSGRAVVRTSVDDDKDE